MPIPVMLFLRKSIGLLINHETRAAEPIPSVNLFRNLLELYVHFTNKIVEFT